VTDVAGQFNGAVELSRKLASHFGLDNARFDVADVTALPAADGEFDRVWASNVLQFVDRGRTLSEAHRVLTPGGILFLGVYNGAGRVLEKFFHGYQARGPGDNRVRFAIKSLKQGPLFSDGNGTFASPENIEKVMAQFGFEICAEPAMEVEMGRRRRPTDLFADELSDLQVLGSRLESDPDFAARFAEHPEIAYTLPQNLHFCARRV